MLGRSGELKGRSSKREWVRREEEGEERDKAKDTRSRALYKSDFGFCSECEGKPVEGSEQRNDMI